MVAETAEATDSFAGQGLARLGKKRVLGGTGSHCRQAGTFIMSGASSRCHRRADTSICVDTSKSLLVEYWYQGTAAVTARIVRCLSVPDE